MSINKQKIINDPEKQIFVFDGKAIPCWIMMNCDGASIGKTMKNRSTGMCDEPVAFLTISGKIYQVDYGKAYRLLDFENKYILKELNNSVTEEKEVGNAPQAKSFEYQVFFTSYEDADFCPINDVFFVLEDEVGRFMNFANLKHLRIDSIELVSSQYLLKHTF